ncbi:MAG TPA: NAD-dependent epimerase/dehydratase family protein [Woeseiaceae bacterium]|nr:NAD-dependent epimerase/dehydratase family protein [Woeseiaceae bacterium]
MRILVLGGTGFIGPHMVREALRRGHNVTLFNRGKTNDSLFPDLESIHGDRGGDLKALQGGKWDAVIDNSGYVPRHVENSARILSPSTGYYLYISTCSVYADFTRLNDETSPLATIADESVEEVNGETYGPLKALCEKRAAAEIGADRLAIIRPTYVCGPGDHTDRFTYYPVRTLQGGDMAWPGGPLHSMQIVDVRDLANFTIDCVDRHTTGIYNAVNPVGAYTFGDLLADSQAVSGSSVEPVWLDDAFIAAHDAEENFPIYDPLSGPESVSGFSEKRALAAGLLNRPARETVRDLLAWWNTLPGERVSNARFRMSPEREAELLLAYETGNSRVPAA